MTYLLAQVETHLQRIQALIPPDIGMKEYLRQTLDEKISSISTSTSMGIVPPSLLSATQVYASARIAVELVDDPERLAAKPEGIVDLGVVEWLLRPALLLRDGLIESVAAGPWKGLAADIVQQYANSVCRLDIVVEGYIPLHVGTGFVIGKDANGRNIVITNAHVVEEAIRLGWSSISGLKFVCDFERYATASTKRHTFPLTNEYHIHPRYDLALVYLDEDYIGGANTQPIPLTLSDSSPDPLTGFAIGVLGHPSFNSNLDPFPMYFGFGQDFGVKRFSLGYIRTMKSRKWRDQFVEVFLHDATTLSGSSGSCILNLSDMRVIGLHFGGWPKDEQLVRTGGQDFLAHLFEANGAVPLWTLTDDPLLSAFYS
jgi:hypothetical protein